MDGTGPMGLGARTGFGRGRCAGANDARPAWGCGHGSGFGRRMRFGLTMPEVSKDELLSRKVLLERRLSELERQIEEL